MRSRFVLALLLAAAAAPLAEGAMPAVDLVAVRNLVYQRAIVPFADPCAYCLTGPVLDLDRHGEEGTAPAPLPPGQYYFEALLDPPGCPQAFSATVLAPGGGAWSVPVLVWRDHAILVPLDPFRMTEKIEDHTGTAGPLQFGMSCLGGRLLSNDLLVLPEGNLGLEVTASITVGALGDVDVFPAGP